MENLENTNNQTEKKPAWLRMASGILLVECIFLLSPLFIFLFTGGIRQTNFFTPLLFLPIIAIPFCFLVSNMKKAGLYGVITLTSIVLIYLIYILIFHSVGPFITLLVSLPVVINVPIIIYLLSIRNKFV
jgi:hypothetical protein